MNRAGEDEMSATGHAAGPDEVRARVHGLWTNVAPAWREHAGYIDGRGAEITARLLDLAALEPGHRVLELACGAGGLGLAAAAVVAPGGEVVMSDIVPELAEAAAERARERGLTNATGRVLDIERIDEPDAAYDAVICREGLMFAVEPARATAEIGRVLRPGGRLAAAVWGPPERNPWLTPLMDSLSAHLGRPVPPPGFPGPFSLSDAGRLAQLLESGGLTDVEVTELEVVTRAGSFDEWWTRTCALAGPVASILASLPPEGLAAVHERTQQAASPYASAMGLEFPGVTLLASGRRAG
jgi:SAM-dependent methyltransferase